MLDSEILLRSEMCDGAAHPCGYAVEIAPKSRSCKTLSWVGYPSTGKEFQNFQSFRTHNLEVLLSLAGIETLIKSQWLAEWSTVTAWDPEAWYMPVGSVTRETAELMIDSAKVLLENI